MKNCRDRPRVFSIAGRASARKRFPYENAPAMTSALFGPLALTPGAISATRSGERPMGTRSSASAGRTTSPGFDSRSGSSPIVTACSWRSNPSNSKARRYSPAAGSFKAYEPLPSERAEAARAGSSARTPAARFTETAVTDAFATARPDGSVMRPVTVPGPPAHTWAERPISNPQSDTHPAPGVLVIVLGGLGSDSSLTPMAKPGRNLGSTSA